MNLENNKIIAAILLAGLIAMISGTAAKILYSGGSSHHEAEEKRGFKIEGVAEDNSAGEEKKVEVDKNTLIATASAEQGANSAKKCLTCHSMNKGEAAKVGPNLWGIVDGNHAHMAGFQYSKVISDMKDKKWTYEELWAFINNPQAYAKGTKMAFAGIKNPQELANVIAYLRTLSDSPVPLPQAAAAPAEEKK